MAPAGVVASMRLLLCIAIASCAAPQARPRPPPEARGLALVRAIVLADEPRPPEVVLIGGAQAPLESMANARHPFELELTLPCHDPFLYDSGSLLVRPECLGAWQQGIQKQGDGF